MIKQYYTNNRLSQIYNNMRLQKYSNAFIDETEIPYIAIGYYEPKIDYRDNIIIPFYCTDFYQYEYVFGEVYAKTFKLRYEIDGVVDYKIIKAGDQEINLGKLNEGIHWYSLQIEDEYGRVSRRLFNDIWIYNKDTYEITSAETHIITDDDLIQYNIIKNLDNTATTEQLQNNRIGLTNLFANLQSEGYKQCVLPIANYRVNYSPNGGTGDNSPIIIPTNFTVDMNGSTFKLHPYDDREYGDKALVYGLMVKMTDCFDSHLINGTLEGDYAERQEMIWEDGTNAITGDNGEHNGIFATYGCEFCSLDNINIKQVTGYNVCSYLSGSWGNAEGKWNSWTDDVAIIGGVEVTKLGYTTCAMGTISEAMLEHNYIVCSVWLDFGGLKGYYWDFDFHFYDENEEFIETIKSYQYARCRIPEGAKYFRMTFHANSSEVSGLSVHHMKSTRYFEINNCNWIDNRTCCAPFQFQHYAINNCTFTRSGQSITPCELDIEDGWEQSQDFFFRYNKILEKAGTSDIIAFGGINHIYEYNEGIYYTLRYRTNGITIRNDINSYVNITRGWMTGNTVRVYNNKLINCSMGYTEETFWGNEKIWDNCVGNTIISNYMVPGYKLLSFRRCNINLGGTIGNGKFIDCNFYIDDLTNNYTNSNLWYTNCNFYKGVNSSNIIIHYNQADAKRIYTNCIFYDSTKLLNKFYFNSGNFINCTFKDTLLINPNTATKCIGQIQFNNCIFEKEVTINCGNNSYVQFNNCKFLINPIYVGTSEQRCEFNDFIPNEVNYVSIDLSSPYLDLNDGTINATITQLPYTATKTKYTTDSSNPNIATLDINGVITLLDEGECELIVTNECGVIGSYTIYVKDFDYANKYIYNETGELTWTPYGVTDYNYLNIYGGNTITISSPNLSVSSIQIVEYNIDKNVIQFTSVEGSSATIILNENTAYIRVSFDKGGSKDNLQLLYEYTIETVTN